MNKNERKMNKTELEGLMHMRKRAYYVNSKKGKGSYDRKKFKDFSALVY